MLQQDIAEELERERKRNKKELAALQHTNAVITRQRDESQRVVLHLRSLIDGQTHHMEHIVRSLNEAPELSGYIAEGYEDGPEDSDEHDSEPVGVSKRLSDLRNAPRHSYSRASTVDSESKAEGENVTPEMENHFFNSLLSDKTNGSRLSITDVADRHLRDKTDAIADIIRNISEQCAAAVEGLQLAQDAEQEDDLLDGKKIHDDHLAPSEDGQDQSVRTDGSEMGEAEESSFLSPQHNSSIPPTPDLVHNRSSTSMSMVSSALESDRSSQHYGHAQADMGTKIMQLGEEDERGSEVATGHVESGKGKMNDPAERLARPLTARLVQ